MQKICRPVERVDEPSVTLVRAAYRSAFLQNKAITGPSLAQSVNENLLGLLIRSRYEIARSFHRNLKIFQFSEVALQTAPGLEGGSNHDIHQCGCNHNFINTRYCRVRGELERVRTQNQFPVLARHARGIASPL